MIRDQKNNPAEGRAAKIIVDSNANSSGGFCRLLQGLTDFGGDFVEDLRFVEGDFAEHFTIESDSREFQPVNEPGIGDAAHFSGRRDAGDPKRPKIAFAIAAVAVSGDTRPDDGFFDDAQQLAPSHHPAFGLLEQAIVSPAAGDAITDSHDSTVRSEDFRFKLGDGPVRKSGADLR